MTSATQPAYAPDEAVIRARGSTGAGDAALGPPAGRSPAASDDPGAVPACNEAASLDDEERRLVAALRDRDEAAFAALLDRYQLALVNLALA